MHEFTFDLQRFFGGSSTKIYNETAKVPEITPEEKAMQGLTLKFAEYLQPTAYAAADYANNALFDNQVSPDFTALNSQAMTDTGALMGDWKQVQSGVVPQELQDARINALNYGLDKTMGTALNGLAQKGILNSSVTQNAMGKIGEDAMNTLNSGYGEDLSTASQLINQGSQMAMLPTTNAAALQEASMNAPMKYLQLATGNQAPSTDAWKTLMSARYSLKSEPTAVTTQNSNIGGSLLGAAATIFCFAGDVIISTPAGGAAISTISAGDKVVHGKNRDAAIVTAVHKIPEKQVPVMVATNHRYVVVTKSQPFMCVKGDAVVAVNAEDLSFGDVVVTEAGHEMIRSVKPGSYQIPVYDIDLDADDNLFFANGFLVEGMRFSQANREV